MFKGVDFGMNIDAVSFDLWFTLIWEDDDGAKEYRDKRVDVLYKWLSRYVDVDYDDVLKYYELTGHIRMLTPIPSLIKYIGSMSGVELDDETVIKIANEYIYSTLSLKPNIAEEAAEVLEVLDERGYPIGILTNTSFNEFGVRKLLDNAGLGKYVDAVVSSCDIGYMKPSREAFIAMIDKLGVEPMNLLHVGDSYLDDVVGAVSTGVRSVLYTGLWKYYRVYSGFRDRPLVKVRLNIPVIDNLKKIYIKIL